MASENFIAYFRVSTDKQGKSGLGLEAQQKAVKDYLSGGNWNLVASFVEIESGRRSDRPKLQEALVACRIHKATLVVAKVDRLTRSVGFLHKLIDAGVEVRFCDLPQLEGAVGRFMLTQMAAVAELEAGLISKRTKDALSAAKARGVKLGNNPRNMVVHGDKGRAASLATRFTSANDRAKDLAAIVTPLMSQGQSLRVIAATLDAQGIKTARGSQWTAAAVSRVIKRLAA
jgi:DNA invertase Pin-like site-specific DNA recombinase